MADDTTTEATIFGWMFVAALVLCMALTALAIDLHRDAQELRRDNDELVQVNINQGREQFRETKRGKR